MPIRDPLPFCQRRTTDTNVNIRSNSRREFLNSNIVSFCSSVDLPSKGEKLVTVLSFEIASFSGTDVLHAWLALLLKSKPSFLRFNWEN